ncbi:hypothetical protein ACES2I_17665 [Bdellovibrio bacteriovorus]|uniref:hypothetical protein n=1 Tax=Bdellovibrio bacteriovorus TaxID=959 RepID=UPI0035A665F8
MFKSVLVVGLLSLSACATIVKSERIPVRFVGGLQDGKTEISLPDGQYTAHNGQTTVLVSRSKSDIPVTITCNSQSREGIIPTSFDPAAGILGNIVFGGIIGIAIDASGDKAYDPPKSFNMSSLCSTEKNQSNVAQEKDAPKESRNPSSFVKVKQE